MDNSAMQKLMCTLAINRKKGGVSPLCNV
jgi:hypothetical protein